MHITLDEEQWQVSDESSLMEILATISDRAQAQHRIVTSLTIGGKAISDRDLAPGFLNQSGKNLGAVQAISKSLHCNHYRSETCDRSVCRPIAQGRPKPADPVTFGSGHVGSIDSLAWAPGGLHGDVRSRPHPRRRGPISCHAPPLDSGTVRRALQRRPGSCRRCIGIRNIASPD